MHWASRLLQSAGGGLLFASLANGAPAPGPDATPTLSERQSTDRYVFAHFMIGITTDRTSAADYDADIQRAKAVGIDAFALNFGPDTTDANYTQQLVYAYDSAASNDFKVFLSFDFNDGQWGTGAAEAVGERIGAFGSRAAQLKVDNKAFVSTFVGDALSVSDVKAKAGIDIYFAPNFNPGGGADWSQLDAAFSWYAWPTDGSNNPPSASSTYLPTNADTDYATKLGDNKDYVAPVSPWFYTHFGSEVSFGPKNWIYPSDLLWFTRWQEILKLGSRFVEIITWNDYGESHYIGPLAPKHYDDGNSKWTNDMPHNGWADLAAPFVAAYKAGSADVTAAHIASEKLVYWFRPQPKGLDCSATDNVGAAPTGADQAADSVFVVTLLKSAAKLSVTSGDNGATKTFDAPAGAASFAVPLGAGKQSFKVTRGDDDALVQELSGDSPKTVSSQCVCGLYNFNAFVGTLPAGAADALSGDGLSRFTEGLKDTSCKPTPTLASKL